VAELAGLCVEGIDPHVARHKQELAVGREPERARRGEREGDRIQRRHRLQIEEFQRVNFRPLLCRPQNGITPKIGGNGPLSLRHHRLRRRSGKDATGARRDERRTPLDGNRDDIVGCRCRLIHKLAPGAPAAEGAPPQQDLPFVLVPLRNAADANGRAWQTDQPIHRLVGGQPDEGCRRFQGTDGVAGDFIADLDFSGLRCGAAGHELRHDQLAIALSEREAHEARQVIVGNRDFPPRGEFQQEPAPFDFDHRPAAIGGVGR